MNSTRLPYEVGQSSAVDELAGGCPEVWNLLVDGGGANIRRPGRVAFITLADGSDVIGLFVHNRNLIIVTSDRRFWRVDPGAPDVRIPLSNDALTTQLEGSQRPTFIADTQRLIIAGGGRLQQWRVTEPFTERLDTSTDPETDDPPLSTHVTSLDQFIVANDTRFPNQFHWSAQGDGVHGVWPPLNFNTADANPDPVVAVHANSRELYVFGTKTLQVYGVVPDPLLPFAAAVTLNIGCIAPYAVVQVDENFTWLDDRRRFVMADGRGFQVMSDAISSTLRELPKVDDAWGARVDIGSFSLVLWVFPAAKRSFYFDLNRKQWGEWRGSRQGEFWNALNVGAYIYWPEVDKHMVGLADGSSLYSMSFTSPTDFDGQTISWQRTLPYVDNGNMASKACGRMRYTLRRGVVPYGETDLFEASFRDDLGSWAPWTRLSIGDQSDTAAVIEDYPGGVYRRRQHRIRGTGTAPFTLAAVELYFEQLEAAA